MKGSKRLRNVGVCAASPSDLVPAFYKGGNSERILVLQTCKMPEALPVDENYFSGEGQGG